MKVLRKLESAKQLEAARFFSQSKIAVRAISHGHQVAREAQILKGPAEGPLGPHWPKCKKESRHLWRKSQ